MKNIYVTFSKVFGILVVFGVLLAPMAYVAAQTVPADVAITVSPGAVCSGGAVDLEWTSSNAEVSISPGIGHVDPYGGITLHPTQNTTYTITGTNSTGGHGQATAKVTIISGCDDDEDGPTVSITADDTSLDMDDSTVVRWESDNANTCSASGGTNGWSGPKGLSGSFNTGSLDDDETYIITCTNSEGSASDSVNINVSGDDDEDDGDEPSVDLTADDTSVSYNDDTMLRWESDDADTCRATNGTNGWSGKRNRSGSFNTGRLTRDTTFKIECENDEGEDDDSVTIRVGNDINVDNDSGPSVATDPATGVTGYSAVLNGRVNGNGLSTTEWFTYGTNPNFGASTSPRSSGSGFTAYNSQVSGLTPNTTYYFRAVAQNSEGTVYGNTLAFTTPRVGSQTIVTTRPVANSLVLIDSKVDRSQPIVPTIDNSMPRPGDEIVYTVNYQNVGNAAITNLVLRLNLPSEVDYMFSTPSNPTIAGDTLIFNLGTLRANGQGTVTARVRVRDNIPAGTDLEFPAILTYIDPSGQPQSVAATVSAEVWSDSIFGANAFWAGSFFPGNILELLFVIILLAILVLLVRRLMFPPAPIREIHTYTTTDNHDHH